MIDSKALEDASKARTDVKERYWVGTQSLGSTTCWNNQELLESCSNSAKACGSCQCMGQHGPKMHLKPKWQPCYSQVHSLLWMMLLTIPRRNGPVNYVWEDAALWAALQALEESDKEETDGSVSVLPMLLREARSAVQAMKAFVQENQGQCGFACISWGY